MLGAFDGMRAEMRRRSDRRVTEVVMRMCFSKPRSVGGCTFSRGMAARRGQPRHAPPPPSRKDTGGRYTAKTFV